MPGKAPAITIDKNKKQQTGGKLKKTALYFGGLCFLTGEPSRCGLGAAGQARAALEAGIKWVQLRMKDASRREVWEASLYLSGLAREQGAALIINDYADVAIASGSDGVHLGQDDLPLKEARLILGGKLVGISTHDMAQAEAAWRGGADYIGFGPVCRTVTKDAGPAKGIPALAEVCKTVKIPVVAIGGITLQNARDAIDAGAGAVAVSSAIYTGDIRENAKRFLEVLKDLQDF